MKKLFTVLLAASALLMLSCTKGDGDADYGNTFIYIPQAMADGGLTSDYPVPSGGGQDTYNFRADEEGIHIMLGILRSGKEAGKAFSVSVKATSSDFPSYTLPDRVFVDEGHTSATFYLDLPRSVLEDFASQTPSVTVAISDPTNYALSERASSVRVVVDIDALSALING